MKTTMECGEIILSLNTSDLQTLCNQNIHYISDDEYKKLCATILSDFPQRSVSIRNEIVRIALRKHLQREGYKAVEAVLDGYSLGAFE